VQKGLGQWIHNHVSHRPARLLFNLPQHLLADIYRNGQIADFLNEHEKFLLQLEVFLWVERDFSSRTNFTL
jgi:hypothetical protein